MRAAFRPGRRACGRGGGFMNGGAAGFTNSVLVEKVILVLLLLGFLASIGLVLAPFVVALLFGSIIAIAGWPLRARLTKLGIGVGTTATLLLLGVVALVAVPILAFAPRLTVQVATVFDYARDWAANAPRPPLWLHDLPLVGDRVFAWWADAVGAQAPLRNLLEPYAEPIRRFLVGAATGVGESLLQLILALAIATMFWARGDVLGFTLVRALRRLGGDRMAGLAVLTANAVRGVFYGVVGTALAQAAAMGLGLYIAGVPGALPLAFVTLLLAVSQIGGPFVNLVWVGAAYYLYHAGQTGLPLWFMIAWGIMVGMLDNVLKPMLIGATMDLPLTLIIVGVFGGFLAFGFLGLFIGPVLIAIAYTLLVAWMAGPFDAPESP
ncbi:AI-2E family transporter [Alsobacter sp. SYSU M60028]|uniref:AI-2E family transporter n=1 Tax=Alsobacter ponti TaxID=2962936 RepID=A0ABT1LBH2_9HYPH|nr:AI-2E family transporter [Alsobacter ponti]MCP8938316.1 AI-2E family transporter [Alsobacter ponti]